MAETNATQVKTDTLNTALDDAVARDQLDEVIALLDRGAELDATDPLGWTPLMNAAWIGSVDIVNYLIDRGADPEVRDPDGFTALTRIQTITHDEYGHEAVISALETAISRKQAQ